MPEMAQTRAQIFKRFNFLGRLMGKALSRWLYRSFAANDRIFFLSEGTKLSRSAQIDGGEE